MKEGVILEIKNKLSLVDFIGQYIKVEKAGKNFRAKCPFHNEKTPSFYISEERNSYYCFGCGKKGDIFSFLEEYEGLSFKESLKTLAEKANVSLSDNFYSQEEKNSKTILLNILKDANSFYEKQLSISSDAIKYLSDRGVLDETKTLFKIGYAPKDWKSVYNFLLSKGYKEDLIEESGLIKKGGSGYYDRFRDRIMFPFFDVSENVIGFTGRIIDKNSKEAKYVNSPENILFNKSNLFYGLFQAKEYIRKNKKALFVEGQMDVIMTFQSGVRYVVASSGTAFSEDLKTENGEVSHLGIIKRFTDVIYFAFDNDQAGIKAMYRAVKIALNSGFLVYCISISQGKDFAEIAQNDSKAIKDIIESKEDSIMFFVRFLLKHVKKELINKSISEKIWPLIFLIKSPIEKSRYLTQITTLLKIPEKNLIDDFYIYEKTQDKLKSNLNTDGESHGILSSNQDLFLEKMFGVLFYLDLYKKEKDLNHFEEKVKSVLKDSFNIIKDNFENKREELIFFIEKDFKEGSYIEDFNFVYKIFKKEFYKKELTKLQYEIIQDDLLGLDTNEKLKEVANISQKLKEDE